MRELNISAKIKIYTIAEALAIYNNTIDNALQFARNSYSPYSQFAVGCVVELATGELFGGSNQENAAYTSGLCAERTALNYVKANYPESVIRVVAVVGMRAGEVSPQVCFPCGECRQVMCEIERRQSTPLTVLLIGASEVYEVVGMDTLLPLCFNL